MSSAVRVRGTKEGVTITFGFGEWNDLLQELDAYLNRVPHFFRGGRVAVSVGLRQLSPEDIHALGDLLSKYDMTLWAIWSTSEDTQREAAALGLETGLDDFRSDNARRSDVLSEVEKGKIVMGPVRSGQRIQYEGSIVVLGDVHPGAEIIADGHIIVWGHLAGIAHAGASGRVDTIICALNFNPTQVRIGPYVAQGGAQETPGVPEMAHVVEGYIVVEPWTGKRRPI